MMRTSRNGFAGQVGVGLVLSAALLLSAAPLEAQESGMVTRLTRFGRMDRQSARQAAERVHTRMTENARRGGNEYDGLRQAFGGAIFGGPGDNRAEYERRLREVLSRLSRGLTADNLVVLFSGDGAALRCARLFELPLGQCDALVAAAAQQAADLPYLAPDDGRALTRTLSRSGIPDATARQIVRAFGGGLLAVPAALDDRARRPGFERLMRECPGGLPDLEARVRAWHLGPTEGLARCIGQAVGREGRAAPRTLATLFGMEQPRAVAFLRWAHDQPTSRASAPTPAPAPSPPPSRGEPNVEAILAQGHAHYRARRYQPAADAYQRVLDARPTHPDALQGLAASRLAAGDAAGAATIYRRAARELPRSAGVQVGLGRALTQTGDRDGAIAAYRLALALEPGRADATRALEALGRDADVGRIREQARAHFSARRYREAAAAYRALTERSSDDARAFAGLGASLLAAGDAAGAVQAYRRAVALSPQQAPYHAALGTAFAAAGDASMARRAFQHTLSLDGNNRAAREGLARLESRPTTGPTPPPAPAAPPPGPPRPTLPETPARDDIVRTLAPLRTQLERCAPTHRGRAAFRIVILGETGRPVDVEALGVFAGTDEGTCMETRLRGASFPRFTRERLEINFPFALEGPEASDEPEPEPEPEPGDEVDRALGVEGES